MDPLVNLGTILNYLLHNNNKEEKTWNRNYEFDRVGRYLCGHLRFLVLVMLLYQCNRRYPVTGKRRDFIISFVICYMVGLGIKAQGGINFTVNWNIITQDWVSSERKLVEKGKASDTWR